MGPLKATSLSRLLYNLALPVHLRDRSFDMVIGFDFDGFLIPSDFRSPYSVALKGVLGDETEYERGWAYWHLLTLSKMESFNARKARTVLLTSRHSRRIAMQKYGLTLEQTTVVPEGIELRRWDLLRLHHSRQNRRQRKELRPTILTVARQYRRKNTRTLILAIDKLRNRFPNILLHVVGGGPELPALRRLTGQLGLKGNVILAGPVRDTRKVEEAYFQADLFCLPTRQEGFGIVFLEAMASGLPIVASRAGAVPEVVPDKVAGFLEDPDDVVALADRIGTLLEDPVLRSCMSRAGLEHVRRYDSPVVARRFLTACGLSDS